MTWPSAQDFCRAIKNPSTAFTDADLKTGDPVLGPNGLPLAVAGRASEVFQVCAADGRSWAVKCYRHPDPDLARRYAKIEETLEHAGLAFTVGCGFLEHGIRVGGQSFACLKMEWVEGQTLLRVAREQAGNAAALDSIFQTWVRLCRRLREAGAAHGDLEASNALLVPGLRAGTYGVKLVDYDAAFIPSLSAFPSREHGQPAFQHPARAVARISSLDVDRFPHLVIGTALKALTVIGPTLWERYGGADNLLFMPADFSSPAASGLMKELWQTADPALQGLVGRLAIAAGRLIPETPWLDQVAPDGVVALLSTNEYRQAAAALGFEVPKPTPAFAQPVAAAPASEVLSLDEEREDPLPARAERRPTAELQRTAKKRFPLVKAALAIGVLLGIGGVVAGLIAAGNRKVDEGAQARLVEEPQPQAPTPPKPAKSTPPKAQNNPAAPGAGSKVVPPPADPVDEKDPDAAFVILPQDPPVPVPPNLPPVAILPGGVGFQRIWSKPTNDVRGLVRVHMARDGQTVFVSSQERVELFDAKNGDPRVTLRGPGVPPAVIKLWSLDGNRVALSGSSRSVPAAFDLRTGNPLPALVLPDLLPPAAGALNLEWEVSPEGRYVFMGNHGKFIGNGYGPSPYRVVDTTTGKVLREGEWAYGSARFTADSTKLLIAGTDGRVFWIKLPSGEVEREWKFDPNAFPRNIAAMSADGSLFVYFGRPSGQPFDSYVVDGKTGQVLRKCGPFFNGDRSVLSADGKWLAGVVPEGANFQQYSAVITDARTGAVLVRTPLDGGANDFMRLSFSSDGAFVLHHRTKNEVQVYELRGNIPAGPAIAVDPVRLPDPLVVPRPPADPPAADRQANLPPDVPLLKPRWKAAAKGNEMFTGRYHAPLYSRDGRTLILTGGTAGTITTYDAKTGAERTTFAGHTVPSGVEWLSAAGDNRAVSGGLDGTNTAWDTYTGKPLDPMKFPDLPPLPDGARGHAGITWIASPSGRYTVRARTEAVRPFVPGPLRILDTVTGKEVVKADWKIGLIRFAADESRVFVFDGVEKVQTLKLPSGEVESEWKTESRDGALVMGITADLRTMLFQGKAADGNSGVHVVDTRTGRAIRPIVTAAPYQIVFSNLSTDGRFISVGRMDITDNAKWYVDLFETSTWRKVARLEPPDVVNRGAPFTTFSPDGKDLAVYYLQSKELRVYTLPEGVAALDVGRPQQPVPALPLPRVDPPQAADPAAAQKLKARWVTSTNSGRAAVPIRYDTDTRFVVMVNITRRTATVIDSRTGKLLNDRVEGLRWSGPGDVFVLHSGHVGYHYRTEPAITVWNLQTGKGGDAIPVPAIPPGPDRTNARQVFLSPNAKLLAVGRTAKTGAPAPFRVIDLASGEVRVSFDWTGGVVHFTPDSSRVLVSEASGRCRWFKLPSGEEDGGWNLPQRVANGAIPTITSISDDGRVVGYYGPPIGGDGASLAILDGKTGEVKKAFGREYNIGQPSVSGDAQLAAVIRGSDDGAFTVEVLEVDTGRVIATANVESNRVVPTFFLTPDGKALIVNDYNNQKIHWFDLLAKPAAAPKLRLPGLPPDARKLRVPEG